MSRHTVRHCVLFLTPLLGTAQSQAPPQPASGIRIRIVQGDGAINSIRLRRGHDPVAQIVDSSGEPLSGATVTFLLPATGPSGAFRDGGLSFTAQTDAKGAAILYSTGAECRSSETIQALVNLALTAGQIGKVGAGIFAVTAHNNLQGVCDMGMLP
ncbi:MAG: hypothetical protein LAQ30_09015, partial [Acidobacteriia bacterium]|nr:hypothetical protein [Terriglobia bacterium]